jgi:hypothetical protein
MDEQALVAGSLGPAKQLEIQGRIAKSAKPHPRFRLRGKQRIAPRHFEQDVLQFVDVCSIGNAYLYPHPKAGFRSALVDHLRVGNNRIGDGYLNVIPGEDPGAAHADFHHLSSLAGIQDDEIPGAKGVDAHAQRLPGGQRNGDPGNSCGCEERRDVDVPEGEKEKNRSCQQENPR